MVYCKSCSYLNFNTLLNATALPGAVVKVKLGTWTSHKCEVSLVSSPLSWCSKPTNLNNGQVGADLAFEKTTWGLHDEGPGFETEGLIPPLRSIVAVQEIVYCKPCRFQGIPTLLGASPLSGAVVRLQCDSIRTPTTVYATTDKNGYFFAQAPTNVTSFGANSCRAYLVSSPLATCQKPTDLNWGLTGAPLRFERWLEPITPGRPLPLRMEVAVHGFIVCGHCRIRDPVIVGWFGYLPLPGAIAKLQCNNMGSTPKSFYGVARDNGYFFIQVPKNDLSNYGAHTCNVTVSSSPLTSCPVDKSQTPVPIKFSEVLEGVSPIALYNPSYILVVDSTEIWECP
ncbi:hypothetical protein QJS10_CPB20g01769 [Acorus calamus]|uniref:Uncharacterized protein n=1 Tax=Acorus calamus TaxID=4465 RepID=A0AAV9C920_ACOCL|nr:hypothetical protein QJS10_CPB20g01769 [Acorus calamus]